MNDEKIKEIIKKIARNSLGDEGFELSIQEQEEVRNAIKGYIENNDRELELWEKVNLIIETDDVAYIKECLNSKQFEMDFSAQKRLVKASKDEELIKKYEKLIKKYEKGVRVIRNISELSYEDLEKDVSCVGVKIADEEHGVEAERDNTEYTKEKYLAIRKVADKLLNGVKIPEKGDAASELAAFLEISRRLAYHMEYDKYAVSPEGKENSVLAKTCRNLHGGLLEGKCVCVGYAEILRNILACVGIEAKYIEGEPKKGTGHTWNQVKIGGVWFNTDLTWERDSIVKTGKVSRTVLKTSKKFNKDHGEFSEDRSPIEEKCTVNINDLVPVRDEAKVDLDSPIGRIVMRGATSLGLCIDELRQCLSKLKDLVKHEAKAVER